MLVNISFRNMFFLGMIILSISFWMLMVSFYPSAPHPHPHHPPAPASPLAHPRIRCPNVTSRSKNNTTNDNNDDDGGAAVGLQEPLSEEDQQRQRKLREGMSAVSRMVSEVPLRVVTIDTPQTHAEIRVLVGSLHKQYTPLSDYASEEEKKKKQQQHKQHEVRVVVYGTRLNSVLVQELLLWKNVEYVDIWEELLKSVPISSADGKELREEDIVNNVEYWKPFVIRHALSRNPKVLYMDSNYMLTNTMSEINEHLNRYGSYFVHDGERVANSGMMYLPRCGSAVQGYVADSFAFKNYLIPRTHSISRIALKSDFLLYELDGSKIPTLPIDEHKKAIECQPLMHLKKQTAGDRAMTCLIHTREDILLLPTQIADNAAIRDPLTVPERTKARDYKTHIAIGMPSTSKGSRGKLPQNLPIFRTLLPTLLKTINGKDDKRFYYRMYVVFDEGDAFYDNADQQKAFRTQFDKMTKGYAIELHFVKAVQTFGWTTYLWNIAFQAAMDDGCDYFYQSNDDLRFISNGWSQHFVDLLTNNPVYPNLGAVGPKDRGNVSLFTQSFVHRTHYKIFGYLYPPTFKNWFSDDWMTEVYKKAKSSFFAKGIEVHNTNSAGTRYTACGDEGRKRLASSKQIGQIWIDQWLQEKKKN